MRSPCGSSAAVVCALVLACATSARAQSSYDLDRGFPTQVIDAYPTAHESLEVQGLLRYEREDGGGDVLLLVPEVQYGIAENVHVAAAVPIVAGSGDRTGSGDVELSALWHFLPEEDWWAALAVEGQLTLPTGHDTAGLDPAFTLVATKTLSTGQAQDRLHFNLGWEYNAGSGNDERDDMVHVILGYSRRLDERTVLVADLVYEQFRPRGESGTILEVGAMRHLDDQWTVSAGAGVGLGADAPDFRIQAGIQWTR